MEINLESGLDINTSDMLVNAAAPTFQHNWQKYQGKFLPNSLRFEKNGWAAGWNVYNFEYDIIREKLADNLFAEVGSLNKFVKVVNLFSSNDSANSLKFIFVTVESSVVSGDVKIDGNDVTGELNGKQFSFTWDQTTKTATMNTPNFSLTQIDNKDKTYSFIISDNDSSFNFDFNLLPVSSLTGDAIKEVNFTSFDGKHHWEDYSFDEETNKITVPNGDEFQVTLLGDNEFTFDYTELVDDESLDITFSFMEFYSEFDNCSVTNSANSTNFVISQKADMTKAFNMCSTNIYSAYGKDLLAGNSAVIDIIVPVWLSGKSVVTKKDYPASLCTNTYNAVCIGAGTGIGITVAIKNAYNQTTKYENIVNKYKHNMSHEISPQYIRTLDSRFNQILVGNTIEPSPKWSPYKNTLNADDIWISSSRLYNKLRTKNTKSMLDALGDVYEFGTISFSASDFFELNDVYDWTNPNNVVYTKDDITGISSIKKKGTASDAIISDDNDYVKDNMPNDEQLVEQYIAKLTGETDDYTVGQNSVAYSALYNNKGRYIYNTYEDTDVVISDDEFWPFRRVPKFNFRKTDGIVVEGVYWTNGYDIITDLDEFKQYVIGTRESNLPMQNTILVKNDAYSRTRVVNRYRPCYDFDYIRRDDFEYDTQYNMEVDKFNKKWIAIYSNYASPYSLFDDNDSYNADTYLLFTDIEVKERVLPKISYTKPGMYVGKVASHSRNILEKDNYDYYLPFDNKYDIALYEEGYYGYDIEFKMYQHIFDVTNQYVYDVSTLLHGMIKFGNPDYGEFRKIVPYYFGENNVPLDLYANISDDNVFSIKSLTTNLQSGKFEFSLKGVGLKVWAINLKFELMHGIQHIIAENHNQVTPMQKPFLKVIGTEWCFSWPFYGHLLYKIQYPRILNKDEINDNSLSDRFLFDKLSSSDALFNKANDICLDRDGRASYDIGSTFSLENSAYIIGESSGEFKFSVKIPGLFYNEAQDLNSATADAFFPGILYGDALSNLGNMFYSEIDMPLIIKWKPFIISSPTSASTKLIFKHSADVNHLFYDNNSKYRDIFNSITYTIEQPVININTAVTTKNVVSKVHFTINKIMLTVLYDCINNKAYIEQESSGLKLIYDDFVNIAVRELKSNKAIQELFLDIKLLYNKNKAKFFKTVESDYKIDKADRNNVTIKYKDNSVVYYYKNNIITSPQCDYTIDTNDNDSRHIVAKYISKLNTVLALVSTSEGTLKDEVLSFDFNGTKYSLNMLDLLSTSPGIKVNSTDIRDAEHTHNIGVINPDNEYQIIKQQWNSTVAVEDFWWIDSEHILELNKHSLVLKRNTFELDDWNGNRFIKVFEIDRAEILPSDVRRHFVTSVYNTNREALFVTMKLDYSDILVQLYNPKEQFEKVTEFRITYRKHDIGSVLNDVTVEGNKAYFNGYKALTIGSILSSAELSSTIVDNNMIIGFHCSKNFEQWTIVFNLQNNVIDKVIQGYGFVGLQGDLTGGMIPDKYMDTTIGFNSSVQDFRVLSLLDDLDVNNLDAGTEINPSLVNFIDSKVVGTAEQQWYIDTKIHGIVSHLKYTGNGNFEKELLPITNNYSAVYRSPSFSGTALGDLLPQPSFIANLIQSGTGADVIWQMFMGFCGYPAIWFIAPRLGTLVYLQQTFGQYAYVHYNSMKHYPEKEFSNDNRDTLLTNDRNEKQQDPIMSSDFAFDKQKFSQFENVIVNSNLSLFTQLMLMFQAINNVHETKTSQNEEIQATSTSDTGRKFTSFSMDNISDMLSTAITQQSNINFGLNSKITGVKTLDMFYSTSDEQEVVAGPGYVEHRFVADCVAQSVTDLHVEGRMLQLSFCLRVLTTLQTWLTQKALEITIRGMELSADAIKETSVFGSNMGGAIAAGMYVMSTVLKSAQNITNVATEKLEELLDVVCSKGVQSNIVDAVSKHNLSIEGTHKYGEKNEVFMWPCWGIEPGKLKYTDEFVQAGTKVSNWIIGLVLRAYYSGDMWKAYTLLLHYKLGANSDFVDSVNLMHDFYGSVPFYQASAIGNSVLRDLPDDMAKVEGVSSILPNVAFKNENIGVSDPVFPTSAIQDFIIDKNWDLGMCCTMGHVQWLTVKDTKITNGKASNLYVNNDFCGIASSYMAVEIKRGISKAYMRPWAITPTTLAMNCTGYNSIFNDKLYHAFDGISYRLVDFVGAPGMGKNVATDWYAFQMNDRFKRSNICPSNEFLGNFNTEPTMAVSTIDQTYNKLTVGARNKGLEVGSVSEDKDQVRFSIPILTEHVSTLPAAVKTLSAMQLYVYDGITSLCTGIASGKLTYKAPVSVDFAIGKQNYRVTEEYICTLTTQNAIDVVEKIIPTLGLKYIGSTPTEAYFYSETTRCYYTFTGSSLVKMDMMERFRDIQKGYWDFVNQEVIMPCLMTFKRLNKEVLDKDTETDNIIVPVLSRNTVSGELPPPITTIFNDKSWYKCVSLPSGFAYQGPNRVIINRNVFVEYMLNTMKDNFGKWKKMNREKYVTKREYEEVYESVNKTVNGVDGWTYNPFLLVTSALGQNESTDSIFEWTITFCWPVEMDLLYSVDNFAVVNVTAETMTPGGKVLSRPTHIFLTKELFTRNSNYGYYSFKFQSKNGAGNRERLHIWSDQYIAISSIDCIMKPTTSNRTEQLTQQLDVSKMKEL